MPTIRPRPAIVKSKASDAGTDVTGEGAWVPGAMAEIFWIGPPTGPSVPTNSLPVLSRSTSRGPSLSLPSKAWRTESFQPPRTVVEGWSFHTVPLPPAPPVYVLP